MESVHFDEYIFEAPTYVSNYAPNAARLRLVHPAPSELQVNLLGALEAVVDGHAVPALPTGSQRLLAFLALREHSITRTLAAGTLWPEASDNHAHANLRSAILRLTRLLPGAVVANFHEMQLAGEIAVDIQRARDLAHRLLDHGAVQEPTDLDQAALRLLSAPLLPDWREEWALAAAETWRQLRLHALEALAMHLEARGQHGEAAAAAIAAIQGEPLRETAQATLIHVYVAEGNQSEAVEVFNSYRALIKTQLGLEPTSQFLDSMRDVLKRG